MADAPDDLARLEQRIATLETLVRRLVAAEPPVKATRSPLPMAGATVAQPVDWEQWVGARGLLLVGVVALLASAAFFFKYAFDHGWIAPWLRVSGGIAAGLALAVFGEIQLGHGLRRYGLALVGGGAGLVFVALWSAAGPYALMPPRAGMLLIAVMAAGLAARAAHHDS